MIAVKTEMRLVDFRRKRSAGRGVDQLPLEICLDGFEISGLDEGVQRLEKWRIGDIKLADGGCARAPQELIPVNDGRELFKIAHRHHVINVLRIALRGDIKRVLRERRLRSVSKTRLRLRASRDSSWPLRNSILLLC